MRKNQSLLHLGYWLIAYVALIGIFSISGELVQSVLFASMLLPVVLVASYFFVHKILAGFWFNDRKVLFILATTALFLGVILVELLLVASFLITFGDYNIIKINPQLNDVYVMVSAALLVAFPVIISETVHKWKKSGQLLTNSKPEAKKLTVRSSGKNRLISSDEIEFIESFGDIIKINISSEVISTRKSLSKMEKELPGFIRIHRSYLINPGFIESYTSEIVNINCTELPVGRTYKEAFLCKMDEVGG